MAVKLNPKPMHHCKPN